MFMRTATVLMLVAVSPCASRLVTPSIPPRGWNSFDLQFDRRYNTSVPVWNETVFRAAATAMAAQLLPHGYDTIVIDGGWSTDVDPYGRPIPDVTAWPSTAVPGQPSSFKPLADFAHNLKLKFGIWTLRGVSPIAVSKKLPVYGAAPPVTVDQVAFDPANCPSDQSLWCMCTWDKNGVGINAKHPDAQTFYNSIVELYTSWGVDLIKWDCMYEGRGGYSDEVALASNAIKNSERDIIFSLSPGGGMTADHAAEITDGPVATMLRVTGDFHSTPHIAWVDGIPQHVFVVGNLSVTSGRYLLGVNGSYPDLDMIDLGRYSNFFRTPTAELHAAMWMMAKSPLMYAGPLPITDPYTLNLVTDPVALRINAESTGLQVEYRGNCTCVVHNVAGNACVPLANSCTALWWSTFGKCTAMAAINIGDHPQDSVVAFADIGVPGSSHTVTYVYDKTSTEVHDPSFSVHTEGMGGKLLVVSPIGTAPAEC
eukprot:m.459843 g.459843  ORF g.459843 m.459843 type:complete len:481 (-) comp21844_c0_seq1:154-1596(-)